MNRQVWLVLTVGCGLAFCGCWNHTQDDVVVESVRTRFAKIQESMSNGCVGMTNLFMIGREIDSWISCVSNASRRTELAMELSNIVLSVDLTNQPYVAFFPNGTRYFMRENATTSYSEIIDATCWVMKNNKCSSRLVMEFLLLALQKYKDASFSIPLDFWPLPDESREVCSARRNCAGGAYSFYSATMKRIRRSLLPNRHPIFYVPPPEFHDEFKRRIEPFFDYPSKEEFNKMAASMFLRGHQRQQAPNKTAREKSGETLKSEGMTE